MTKPTLLLVDNGSNRAESVLNLHRLATGLSLATGQEIHPVSLQHAESIPAGSLNGRPADTFVPFMRQRVALGERSFLLLPLFFGPSRALTSFIPEQVGHLEAAFGPIDLRLAPVLCPLPEGEPRLASILVEQLLAAAGGETPRRVILVDHGSPEPRVTAVRRYLAEQLQSRLGPPLKLLQAAMERREDNLYDFNGEPLEHVLEQAAVEDAETPMFLSLLFLSPGRHAGRGGDIESICDVVRRRHPHLSIATSALIGEHPELIVILRDRLATGLKEATNPG